jgi:hypothetical protein
MSVDSNSTISQPEDTALPPLPAKPSLRPQLNGKISAAVTSLPSKFGWPNLARLILGTLLLVLLGAAWFGSNPASTSGSSSSDWSSAAAAASADNIVNGSKTSGAPQQSVVNGWYQNELSVIQTSQNTFLAASSARNGGLLGLLVLAVVGELIIRAFERKPTQLALLPDTREVSNAV